MSEYTLEELKNEKAYILEDIRGGIIPADDREADIYSFMRTYLDDDLGGCDKAELLEELAKCIDGQPYDRPEPRDPFYSQKEMDELAGLMDDFIDKLQAGCEDGKLPPAKKLCEELSASIHALDEKTGCHLMDSWRREELQNWMQDACEASIQEALRQRPAPPGMQMM